MYTKPGKFYFCFQTEPTLKTVINRLVVNVSKKKKIDKYRAFLRYLKLKDIIDERKIFTYFFIASYCSKEFCGLCTLIKKSLKRNKQGYCVVYNIFRV